MRIRSVNLDFVGGETLLYILEKIITGCKATNQKNSLKKRSMRLRQPYCVVILAPMFEPTMAKVCWSTTPTISSREGSKNLAMSELSRTVSIN